MRTLTHLDAYLPQSRRPATGMYWIKDSGDSDDPILFEGLCKRNFEQRDLFLGRNGFGGSHDGVYVAWALGYNAGCT